MAATIPTTDLELTTAEGGIAPYPAILGIAELGPVVYHEPSSSYVVTTYYDCARVLGDARSFRQPAVMYETLFGAPTMTSVEGKRHKELRSIWSSAFTRAEVRSRCEGMVEEAVRRRVDDVCRRVAAGEQVEVVRNLTRQIPSDVIAEMTGVPREDKSDFIRWSDQLVAIFESEAATGERKAELQMHGAQGVASLNDYVAGRLRSGAHDDAPDLIGDMVRSDVSMSVEEMVASVSLLVFGGNDTSSNLMATTLWALGRHPEQWELLKQDRSLVPHAIEEVNRWWSVGQTNWRVADEGAEVAGVSIPAGSTVLCLVGAANRDPSRWDDPHKFDITREYLRNLGFGSGSHMCLGKSLAQLEIETWLNNMLDGLPRWRVARADWNAPFGTPLGPAALVIEADPVADGAVMSAATGAV
ncbi:MULTISPECIES: cytochrome P450 [Gordonia]|uniref:Cytochrome P450 n=1 Tax=Gordonia amicalis TaxID=89053 RepID=A0AAE4QZH0_9ACTN|nr:MULTISPECIES: cytochrome P450 [Gordonia]MCZ0913361.1 cytochrome P450 [Gordonia amicalis]MCZ4577759.1 cytochrome P450 [Gordonia amicalis]MCZ4651389.1 cytochrome P450 [Gordonia amicalis]MDJ0451246.1 cytochrome P450 [Gordonia amicalis]MDV6310583.1 cytochrome P450 [Gordonia amicalis]